MVRASLRLPFTRFLSRLTMPIHTPSIGTGVRPIPPQAWRGPSPVGGTGNGKRSGRTCRELSRTRRVVKAAAAGFVQAGARGIWLRAAAREYRCRRMSPRPPPSIPPAPTASSIPMPRCSFASRMLAVTVLKGHPPRWGLLAFRHRRPQLRAHRQPHERPGVHPQANLLCPPCRPSRHMGRPAVVSGPVTLPLRCRLRVVTRPFGSPMGAPRRQSSRSRSIIGSMPS